MYCLVTGMTASQTRENDSIAGHIAEALRMAGHTVDVGKPSLADVLEDNVHWDHVIVGLGPLHGLGTSSMYGALGLIGKYWGKGLTLFLDDVDTPKINSGMRSMISDKGIATNKLVKPFYSYKREFKIAVDPPITEWLRSVIDVILEAEDFPPIITPSFTYDQAFRIATSVTGPAGQHVVPVNFTSFVPELPALESSKDPEVDSILEDRLWWAVEGQPASSKVKSLGPFAWDVHRINAKDHHLFHKAGGYLAPDDHWHLKIKQIPAIGKPVIVPWRSFAQEIGVSFEALASVVEVMTPDERRDLADTQLKQLTAYSDSCVDVSTILDKIIQGQV
jgi:hypothetical protein